MSLTGRSPRQSPSTALPSLHPPLHLSLPLQFSPLFFLLLSPFSVSESQTRQLCVCVSPISFPPASKLASFYIVFHIFIIKAWLLGWQMPNSL